MQRFRLPFNRSHLKFSEHPGLYLRVSGGLAAGLFLFFIFVIVRRAWLSDDAYITFRTVDNFINGYGLTWNTVERVQAYTHPLWMFMLSLFYFFTHETYFTSLLLSLLISTTAVALYTFKIARTPTAALLGLLVLSLSNAFVDYSTSGLENPLSHLILMLFWMVYIKTTSGRQQLFWLALLAALGGLCRMDLLLVFLPMLLLRFWEQRSWKSALALLAGLLPLLLWECFSLVYYGFLFPNTAYAKLNTGIPTTVMLEQGLRYYADALAYDPLTLLLILGGLLAGLFSRHKWKVFAAFGLLLYLVYLAFIGGDFMRGRFLTLPLLAALLLAFQDTTWAKHLKPLPYALAVVFLLLGLLARPAPTFRNGNPGDQPLISDAGITNERLFYTTMPPGVRGTSLMRAFEGVSLPDFPWVTEAMEVRSAAEHEPAVIVKEATGVYGFFAGPRVYIIDVFALSDPLLARLPATQDKAWRSGHFWRSLPAGYLETSRTGKNVIMDSKIATLFDRLEMITRADLFDPQRWIEIWKMNTGQYDYLVKTSDTYGQ